MAHNVERWRLVMSSAATEIFVLSAEADYNGRRADFRRWSITQQRTDGTAVLEVSIPDGWELDHQSSHPSLAAAKRAAKDVTLTVDPEFDSSGHGWWRAPWALYLGRIPRADAAGFRRSLEVAVRVSLDPDPDAIADVVNGHLLGRSMPRAYWRGYLEAHLLNGGRVYVDAEQVEKITALQLAGWPL